MHIFISCIRLISCKYIIYKTTLPNFVEPWNITVPKAAYLRWHTNIILKPNPETFKKALKNLFAAHLHKNF